MCVHSPGLGKPPWRTKEKFVSELFYISEIEIKQRVVLHLVSEMFYIYISELFYVP